MLKDKLPAELSPKIVLGFDFGLKNIGVAVGQSITATATPIATLKAQDGAPQWLQIQTLIDEWRPAILLVGLPIHMDGKEQAMTQAARRFGNRLNGRFNVPVQWVDERLTSYEAENRMSDVKYSAHTAKLSIDSLSAQLIVEQWFEQQKKPYKND